MAEHVTIARRFNGPPDSAHGGYACGTVARYIDGPAEISLRSPPPLERPLLVERAGGPDGAAPRRGAARGGGPNAFSTCFVCGPDRDPGDGLRVICGPLGGEVVADSWTPARTSAVRTEQSHEPGEQRGELLAFARALWIELRQP